MTGSFAPLRVHALIDSLTWGGAEALLSDLAAGAPAAGIELSVAYLRDVDGAPSAVGLRRNGIEPQLVDVRALLTASGLRRVRAHLARARPDVVHTHLGYADFHGGIAARSLGIPSVSTIHVLDPRLRAEGRVRGPVKARLMAAVRRHAGARVITVSDAARHVYLATGWDAPEHVVTVHNGVARAPGGRRDEVRRALGIAPQAPLAAIVSVLRPGKGHAVAVESVRRVRARLPDLTLLVVGEGPSRDDVAALAAPLGDAARLLGHRDDVMDLLEAADVLLHPTDVDAFPTVLLEAAAAARPVIATAVGGIPEIVVDGETGLLVPAPARAGDIAAALERLLADPALRVRLGAAARVRFEREFTAARWATRLRVLYDEVRAERTGRSTLSPRT